MSTCRNFATISFGLCFFAMAVLLDRKAILGVGPLHWGWIRGIYALLSGCGWSVDTSSNHG